MIHLTENAATHISNYLQNRGKGEGIRIGVKTSGCSGLAYVLEFVDDIGSGFCAARRPIAGPDRRCRPEYLAAKHIGRARWRQGFD